MVARTVGAVLEERLDVQVFVTGGQEQPNQAATQGCHPHHQLRLEPDKRQFRGPTELDHLLEFPAGLIANSHCCQWTIGRCLCNLILHGADSGPLVMNGKDMLHPHFQLRLSPLILQKRAENLEDA
jgi:hypothetical protein